jgi:nucleoside-diphosphate-sugar epimerase
MRVLVLGAGFVGRALTQRLRAAGHAVVGTTTTPAKKADLELLCDEVHVLRGADAEAVAAAAAGCDAVVVCAGPDARRAMSAEERAATYDDVLVQTARSVVSARPPYVVALSSLSVYGDAADDLDLVAEDAPLTASDDASPRCFQAMERTYVEGLPEAACVFRCADVYGGDDPPLADKVRLAHTLLGGSVPFSGEALFYRVHVDDVVAAVLHALEGRLTGVYNLTHEQVPATNRARFDGIGSELGLPPLVFRDELRGPARPVSVARLASTGFRTTATRTEVPA